MRRQSLTVCISLLALVALNAAHASGFRILDLGVDPTMRITWMALNNEGQVVFSADRTGGSSVYLWAQNTGLVDISAPGSFDYARTIDDSGRVGGSVHADQFTNSPVIREPDGSLQTLSQLVGTQSSTVFAMNNTGQAAGTADWHAVMWDSSGTVSRIDDGGTQYTWCYATAISDHGDVSWWGLTGSGEVSFVWNRESGSRRLFPLAGALDSTVYGINNAGRAVGRSGSHAVLWGSDGSPVDLGGNGVASDINNFSISVGGMNGLAVVWDATGHPTYLEMPLGDQTAMAYAANDGGWIAGVSRAADGSTHAVLWQPVPEPSSLAVLATGVSGVLGAELRRRLRRR